VGGDTMRDLFGTEVLRNDTSKKEISFSIYADERTIDSNQHPNGENWIYIALLIIPDSRKSEALDALKKHRNDIKYEYELKFRKVELPSCRSKVTNLAKLWIQELLNDANKRYYFKILGIKKDNLLFELFGDSDSSEGKYSNIYNRFFRTAFFGAINSFFSKDEYEKINISGFFHDSQGQLEGHKYFPWHICHKLAGTRINYVSEKLCFVNSNHKIESFYKNDSQFIQLVDILVGAISHCLDLPTTSQEGKNEVARTVLPLLRDILNNKNTSKSDFNYFRKYDVSFYPSNKLTIEEFNNIVDRVQSKFFKDRRILLDETLFGQQLTFPQY
jgi:hypothetical protein